MLGNKTMNKKMLQFLVLNEINSIITRVDDRPCSHNLFLAKLRNTIFPCKKTTLCKNPTLAAYFIITFITFDRLPLLTIKRLYMLNTIAQFIKIIIANALTLTI